MPVIRIQRDELEKLGVSARELEENVRMIGADLKEVWEEEILVEFFPDRPDLYTVEGVARALKFYLERGEWKRYEVSGISEELRVDESVEKVRPYIVGAVVKGVEVDEKFIKSMMDFQEKLHITVGRKRKKIAIGLHDYDKIQGPFTYTTRPKDFKFIPLGFDEEMSLEEILEKHPKGGEYRHILEGWDEYPVILDSRGEVLSFPPIINGTLTQITEDTRNIFIDMTGTDFNSLLSVLNIVVCSFADRGARIEGVKILYPDGTITTPKFEYREMNVDKKRALKLLGLEMDNEEIEKSLKKMGYLAKIDGDTINVTIPPYRMDILHEVDIVEDIAKGYGYERFEPKNLTKYHRGFGFEWEEKPRLIMVGLGFLEIKSLTLSSFEQQYDMMLIDRDECVVVENPVSEMTETLRTWLIPSLMEILRKNRHRDLPQKIFEVGYVQGSALERHLAFLYEDSKAGFTDAKSIVERILADLGVRDYEIVEKEHGSFIRGRCAVIIKNGKEIGFFGEIHPEVLENFDLGYPVVGGEINLERIRE